MKTAGSNKTSSCSVTDVKIFHKVRRGLNGVGFLKDKEKF